MSAGSLVAWWERHQIPVYLGGLAAGAVAGVLLPSPAASAVEVGIYPVLGLLLYATFLQVPFAAIGHSLRDVRFVAAALVLSFVVVPALVAAVVLPLGLEQAVLLGALLVLLTPCIDYVIVFCGLAGGDARRLLAISPLLMLAQIVVLPLFVLVAVGPQLVGVIEPGPFLEAFGLLIAAPLALAWATGRLRESSRPRAALLAAALERAATAAMVPLMALTLAVVVTSQVPTLAGQLGAVVPVLPIYAGFLLIMVPAGIAVARMFGLDVTATRALVFSGATRNSLVVLPLALALPPMFAVTPAVVIAQTLVELLGMIIYVRFLPRLIPHRNPGPNPSPAPGPAAGAPAHRPDSHSEEAL
ncbi:ACR3 family arsenite efflux pump ArsB [Pseudonocardia sediminis]|uniref:ACR3 family arsenite efflux pump ArsB n=1 Tax=Pseudonocardia sediminis TaxID=1397368 RepID=A0A4Q7UV11_PSEST|nr:arsenic resistance protein [Pseudonocardia sediminis]RZT85616.1 ACR3 family arsenite efflux pump ArsB [Pseudonocardia sediminis]